MDLLNVSLAVKMPTDAKNSIIPRKIISNLLNEVAPKIQQQMGVSVAFVGQEEITSAPIGATDRNSKESRKSSWSRKSVLITLGVVLGAVVMVSIVTIAWYRRKKKR